MGLLLRQHAEQQFEEELYELKKNETNKVPENWQLSPQSVVTYLMGGKLANGFEVTPKYIGHRRLIERLRWPRWSRIGHYCCTVYREQPRAG